MHDMIKRQLQQNEPSDRVVLCDVDYDEAVRFAGAGVCQPADGDNYTWQAPALHAIGHAINDPFVPDWTKAPDWAQWHCVGPAGWGAFYERRPVLATHPESGTPCWMWAAKEDRVLIAESAKFPALSTWRDSLRQRPRGVEGVVEMIAQIWTAGDSRGTWNLKAGETRRDLVTVAAGAVGYHNRRDKRVILAHVREVCDIAFASGNPRDAYQGKTIGGGGLVDLTDAEETELVSLARALP